MLVVCDCLCWVLTVWFWFCVFECLLVCLLIWAGELCLSGVDWFGCNSSELIFLSRGGFSGFDYICCLFCSWLC